MLRIGLILSLLGVVVACGADPKEDGQGDNAGGDGDQGGDGDSGGSFVGQQKSAMITAAEGGDLALGNAAINIPGGALSADTEISVKVEAKTGRPDEANILMDIYDFGPDGTTFNMPVTLSFDMVDVTMPEGEGKPMVAWQNGDKWEVLETTIANGKATAQADHFTPFTLVFVLNADGDIDQVGGQCGEYEPCGGDIAGSWTYDAACVTAPDDLFGDTNDEGEPNPFASCEEQPRLEATIDLTGTVDFGADGAFSVDQTVTFSGGVRFPQSCIDKLGIKCEDLNMPVAEDGNGCLENDSEEPSRDMTSGTYTTDGVNLSLVSANDNPDEPSTDKVTYCVEGDKLTVRVEEENGTIIQYTATRN